MDIPIIVKINEGKIIPLPETFIFDAKKVLVYDKNQLYKEVVIYKFNKEMILKSGDQLRINGMRSYTIFRDISTLEDFTNPVKQIDIALLVDEPIIVEGTNA